MTQWWYGHNAVGFFLTAAFLGMMYYFVPKQAGRPIYSYRLSIVHFWALIFMYMWAGSHHLHWTAIPDWTSTLAATFSIMLLMPSWGGMINGIMTMSGAWDKLRTDPIMRFLIVALSFYGMSTFEGPMMSLKDVNALSHYTDWTVGHVHSGALGWVAMISFGAIYHMLPRLWDTKMHSTKLINVHFWLATIGTLMYITAMWISGIMQGLMWRAYDDYRQPAVFLRRIRRRHASLLRDARLGRRCVPDRHAADALQLLHDHTPGEAHACRWSGSERSVTGLGLRRRCSAARSITKHKERSSWITEKLKKILG